MRFGTRSLRPRVAHTLVQAGLLTLVVASTSVSPAVVASTTPARLVARATDVAGLDPAAQAALLDPLRAAATALDATGRGARTVYAGVALDARSGRTDLYLTDPAMAPTLVAAARRRDPSLTMNQVSVRRAVYPRAALDAASREVVDASHPYAVYAAYPAPDGSGVRVEVADPVVAARTSPQHRLVAVQDGRRVSVPMTFVTGRPRSPHGWDATKWHDRTPFIGGDVLTTDGHRYCTAGLPSVRTRDRHPVMVTAAHCFDVGQRVYTGAGKTWAWGNGRTGSYVGRVTTRSRALDAEVVDGAKNNADESDTSGWKALTSVANSYRGDYVCHTGARSAAEGHPTPCGIEVTIDDLYFREAGHTVRGVEGVDVHGWGSVGGDSGATVFAVEPRGQRQLRGLVSTGGVDDTPDQRRVDWPEAVDIFRTFRLRLNPTV